MAWKKWLTPPPAALTLVGDAAVGDVKSGKTFYKDDANSKLTGTLANASLSAANDTVAAGVYVATTLHAVDADLVAANIKIGVTVFGLEGSLEAGNNFITSIISSEVSHE